MPVDLHSAVLLTTVEGSRLWGGTEQWHETWVLVCKCRQLNSEDSVKFLKYVRPKMIPQNPDPVLVIPLLSEASRAVPLPMIMLNYSFSIQSHAVEGNDALCQHVSLCHRKVFKSPCISDKGTSLLFSKYCHTSSK